MKTCFLGKKYDIFNILRLKRQWLPLPPPGWLASFVIRRWKSQVSNWLFKKRLFLFCVFILAALVFIAARTNSPVAVSGHTLCCGARPSFSLWRLLLLRTAGL